MQISLRWVNELVDLDPINLDDLITRLTLGGFEVEESLEVKLPNRTTIALEISATANRSDSLSIQGLSIEIAALLNKIPKQLKYSTKICPWSSLLESSESMSTIHSICSGFISLSIENVDNFNSPKWLQEKLLASGFPITNNLLDFQNYILIETGYPVELYDLNQIFSEQDRSQIQFSLAPAADSVDFLARNGINYSIDKLTLLLQANNTPISIAGIMGSQMSQFSLNTKRLFIEGSIFNAAHVRQESRRLGLRTDRSSRYEKSLKPTLLVEALYRFVSLLRIHNPNLICKLHTLAKPINEFDKRIKLNYTKVKQVLGPIQKTSGLDYSYISTDTITDALKRLQFQFSYNSQDLRWDIRIPPLRSDDIVREIDIIEEIGRIYGFNNFLTRLPNIQQIGTEDIDYQTRKKLTSCLVNLGFNELIQYSLVSSETDINNEIPLINPLVKDYSNLRSSLLPNLLKTVSENVKKGNYNLEGFEYGHIFSTDSSSLVHEREVLSGIFGGFQTKSNWSEYSHSLSWFEAKGKIEQLFQRLNIKIYWKAYKPGRDDTIFHRYCTAEIALVAGPILGTFGQISPLLANKLNISINIYLFELDLNTIKNQLQQNKLSICHYYSSYPKITKDLSFIVKDTISFQIIRKLLYLNGSRLLKEVNLLDEYRGKSIPKDHTSLCVQLVFQSDSETLQTERIESIIKNLTDVLTQGCEVIIRT
jgi:phenylalanyl-tRNA synthetase beta chain